MLFISRFFCIFFRLSPIRFEVTQKPSLTLRNRLHTETVTCFIAGQSILLLSSQWALFILPLPRPTARSSLIYGSARICFPHSFDYNLFALLPKHLHHKLKRFLRFNEHLMDGVPIISDTVRQRCGRSLSALDIH